MSTSTVRIMVTTQHSNRLYMSFMFDSRRSLLMEKLRTGLACLLPPLAVGKIPIVAESEGSWKGDIVIVQSLLSVDLHRRTIWSPVSRRGNARRMMQDLD